MRQATKVTLVAALTLAGATTLGGQPTARAQVEAYLARQQFGAADVARLHAGEVVARAQSAGDQEMAVIAAVKILVPRAQVLSYYSQMVSYVDGQVTLAFGRFGSPPGLADVRALALDAGEVEALRLCRPGDCDFRLSGATLAALRAAVQWGSPDQAEQVNAFARRAAVDYVTAYQKQGDTVLTTYDDRMRPVSLREQWQGLLSNSPLLAEYAPELRDYLAGYPSKPLAAARDIFYWLKENYGLKPVLSIVHAVIYEPAADPERVYVAQKQLYANHYYDGSLALAVLQGGVEGGRPVTYLIYSNRSRGDMLKGGFGGLKRAVARKQARAAAEQTLGTIKKMLEAPPGR